MDLDALERSAKYFEGEHNFLSFAATDPELASRNHPSGPEPCHEAKPSPSPVRTIYSSAWSQRQDHYGALLVYRVRGDGFLHHMVRNLVGTMLDVGRGRLKAEEIPGILRARSRSAAGPTAPARALFLHSVEYPSLRDRSVGDSALSA
jgi:tRNA pseudouridine38-40 synthase